MSNPSVASLAINERVPLLDALRGFALMGILIMNMPGFSYSGGHEADGSNYWPAAYDQFAEQVRNALFSGKFNSLFSLLFGLASRSNTRACSSRTRSTPTRCMSSG